jgi:hypothetical protein
VAHATDVAAAEESAAAVRSEFVDGAPRSISAQAAHLEGVLAARTGDYDTAAERFGAALAPARSLGYVTWVAEILVDYAASLIADDRRDDAEPLLAEAREIAEPLHWARLLDRIELLEREVPSRSEVTV